ncbi:MAG: peptide deformylase [Polyangiaceae bacterium]|nr:peptide deformylase [Polyangiaceae bacterium]
MTHPARLGSVAACAALSVAACDTARRASPAPSDARATDSIVQAGAPVLRQRAAEVPREQLGSPALHALTARMIAAMRAAPGVGLAAPQLGVGLRVIVLEDRHESMGKLTPLELRERERAPFPVRVIVNPVLRVIDPSPRTFFEGCLSVPGWTALVARAHEVEVEGTDADGAPVRWRVAGWPARILQHELDHLDGALYVDRMAPRSFSTHEHARLRFAGKPAAEILRELEP